MSDANWCVNFTGIQHKVCRAGVTYEDVRGDGGTFPCFADRCGSTQCEHVRFLTEEEAKSTAERFEEIVMVRLRHSAVARQQIVAEHGRWKRGMPGVSGVTECPKCQGRLHYSRAAYNGHVHAKCETKGCLSWME